MRLKLPRHIHAFIDRHQKARYYLRRPGFKAVALPGLPYSPEFMAAYQEALAGQPLPIGIGQVMPGTLRALAVLYYTSVSFRSLKPSSQALYRWNIDKFCREKDRAGQSYGDKRVATLQREHVVRLMAARAEQPGSANALRKILRVLMQHAVEIGLRSDDPTRNVKPIRIKTDGFHSWTDVEIRQFEARHPIGSRARLALALLLYTGQRRSDVVRAGRQHLRDGFLYVRQQKTGAELAIPMHPELQTIIAATTAGQMTFLVTEQGKPFLPQSFSAWFREQCDIADLHHCSAHGLRKAAARRLAEAGCSVHEIAAVTGHISLREVARYTKAVDQKRLAASAMAKTKA
jgi:integrase